MIVGGVAVSYQENFVNLTCLVKGFPSPIIQWNISDDQVTYLSTGEENMFMFVGVMIQGACWENLEYRCWCASRLSTVNMNVIFDALLASFIF